MTILHRSNPGPSLAHPGLDWRAVNDVIAWRNLGRPVAEREPYVHNPALCQAIMKERRPCCDWGSREHGGILYCYRHAPAGSLKL